MYVMIDNFDSFVYNLKAYFQELGRDILVKRCDEITLDELEAMNPEARYSLWGSRTNVQEELLPDKID